MNVCIFSKYRHIFGKERTGPHSIRFMDVALVDYILTIVFAFFLTYITKIPVELTTIFSFGIGIITHLFFGVQSNTTKFIQKITNNYITCEVHENTK